MYDISISIHININVNIIIIIVAVVIVIVVADPFKNQRRNLIKPGKEHEPSVKERIG